MVEGRGGAGFLEKPRAGSRVAGQFQREEFERDATAQALVLGQEHRGHPASANRFEHAEMRDRVADHRGSPRRQPGTVRAS